VIRTDVLAITALRVPVAYRLLPAGAAGEDGCWHPEDGGALPSGESGRLVLVNTGLPLHEAPANHCTWAALAGAPLILTFTLPKPAAARSGVDARTTQLLSKGMGLRFTTRHWAPLETGELHVVVPEHQFSE
jgi:hypothetical protein